MFICASPSREPQLKKGYKCRQRQKKSRNSILEFSKIINFIQFNILRIADEDQFVSPFASSFKFGYYIK